jgi:hypothetical protein
MYADNQANRLDVGAAVRRPHPAGDGSLPGMQGRLPVSAGLGNRPVSESQAKALRRLRRSTHRIGCVTGQQYAAFLWRIAATSG